MLFLKEREFRHKHRDESLFEFFKRLESGAKFIVHEINVGHYGEPLVKRDTRSALGRKPSKYLLQSQRLPEFCMVKLPRYDIVYQD